MSNVDYIDSEGNQVLATGTLADQLRHTISQLRTENTQLTNDFNIYRNAIRKLCPEVYEG